MYIYPDKIIIYPYSYMKPRNYKLQITKNIILALCFLVLDIHYWCQISKDSAIWILAVGFAIFTISRILDIIHDINESRVIKAIGEPQGTQNQLSLILDFCCCAVLIVCFIILCCSIFGNQLLGTLQFLGVFLTSTHAPTKRPASRPLRRSHSALQTLTSAELPPKSNPVTVWHRQAGTRLSLGPRTHRRLTKKSN